jgi:hypothetical protein
VTTATTTSRGSKPVIKEFTAPDGGNYVLHWFSGSARGLAKSSSGVRPQNPYYHTPEVQNITLTDGKGESRTFALTDANATGSDEDFVTLVCAIRQGDEQGPAIALRNEATGKDFFSRTELKTIFISPWMKPKYLMPMVVLCLLTCGGLVFVLLPFLLISGNATEKRCTAFVNGFAFEPML